MSDTVKSILRGFKVVGVSMFALAVLVSIGAIAGKEHGPSQPVVQIAGMVGPKMRAAEVSSSGLAYQDFQSLVTCVYEIGSRKDVLVPGSERSEGRYLAFSLPLTRKLELRLEDENRVIGVWVYGRDGSSEGWVQRTYPENGELTEQDFVDSAYVMLDGPCSASAMAQLGR